MMIDAGFDVLEFHFTIHCACCLVPNKFSGADAEFHASQASVQLLVAIPRVCSAKLQLYLTIAMQK